MFRSVERNRPTKHFFFWAKISHFHLHGSKILIPVLSSLLEQRTVQCNDHFSYQYLLKIFRCATCVDGAEQGQAGYCNKKMSKPRRLSYGAKPKRHYGRPTAAENWGLCSMNCNPIPSELRHNQIQVRTRILNLQLHLVF